MPPGRLRRASRAPSCDFALQSSSCYSSGDLTTSSQVHLALTRPDRFAAGASRGQPDRLRRQANVAIHNRFFACGTIPQTTEV